MVSSLLCTLLLIIPPDDRKDVFVYGRGADSKTIDPGLAEDEPSVIVLDAIYETLVRYRNDALELEAGLAESWRSSSDGRVWTFSLRQNVTFHDGTPFDANAVVFSFMRQIDKQHPNYRPDFTYSQITFQYVSEVVALDPYTVRIKLTKTFAPFLANLTMHSASIVSPTAVKKYGRDFGQNPVGTGAFAFVSWEKGERIVLKRNAAYWGGRAMLSRLIFRSIPDSQERLQMMQAGEIDCIDRLRPNDVKKVRKLPGCRLLIHPNLDVHYLAMHTEKPPFDNVQVCRAINLAINKKALVKLAAHGLALPATNPIPPNVWGAHQELEDYGYDPQRARALLKEAGVTPFETTLWTSDALPISGMATIIRAQLQAVGIQVNIVRNNWKHHLAAICNGEHDMCLIYWIGDNGDPDNFMFPLFSPSMAVKPAQNLAFYKNERLGRLLTDAQISLDLTKRRHLYREAQEIIHDQAPWVPLGHMPRVMAIRDNVSGLIIMPTGTARFEKTRFQ